MRDGVVRALGHRTDLAVVYAGSRPAEVLDLERPPDVVLLDLDLEDGSASTDEAAALIARGSRILVVSALAEPAVVRAMLGVGVSGLVSKREPSRTLLQAVDAVLAGDRWTQPDLAAILASDPDPERPALTETERRVLTLYASGHKLVSVASRLGMSPHTAKEHVDRVRMKYEKAGRPAATKTDLYRRAVQDRMLPP